MTRDDRRRPRHRRHATPDGSCVPLRDEVVTLAQALVRVDSVASRRDGHENGGAEGLAAGALRRHRLDVELYDTGFLYRSRHAYVRRDRDYRGRHNLVARLPGRGGGRSLLLSGHVDTVPPAARPGGTAPGPAAIRGRRLYGRGSWDMKGGLVAQARCSSR